MTVNDFLTICQGHIIPLRPFEKIPLQTAWTVEDSPIKSIQDAQAYTDLGYNIGFRISASHLVLDVDPRNGGAESFDKLPDRIKRLPASVVTPSGGFHVYTQLPPDYDYTQLKSAHPDYPGIDFLHKGKQVVLPGSTLGDGLNYRVHEAATVPLPETPSELLAILRRETRPVRAVEKPLTYLSDQELSVVLALLPVEVYDDNDTWLRVCMAAHHATNGDGIDAFLEWSLQDDRYLDQEQIIRARWASMTSDKPVQVTIRTLCREVGKHVEVPKWLMVRAGIQDNQSINDLFQAVSENSIHDRFHEYLARIEAENDAIRLTSIVALDIASDALLTSATAEILLKKISTKTGSSIAAVRRGIKEMQATNQGGKTHSFKPANINDFEAVEAASQIIGQNQVNVRIANAVIADIMDDCHNVSPLFTTGCWWLWTGTHWNGDTAAHEIKRRIGDVIQRFNVVVTSGLIEAIMDLVKIMIEVSPSVLNRDVEEIRLYMPNVCLHLDKRTATWMPKSHEYTNRNCSLMNVHFKPDAPEPKTWLTFLGEAMTSEHAQRTLACAIVYAASGCRPWLRKAFYFYGPKRSGKSTTLDLIESLLGKNNCSALNILQLGSRNGSAELVGKLANISNETVSKKTIQDDIFKALVSGESIMVEKKFRDPFLYRNTSKLFFAANGFPHIQDESEAVWDRLVLLSFPNSCPDAQADHDLSLKLETEKQGILMWAVKIFQEEYKRDECRTAMTLDVQGAADMASWREVNNPALQWVKDRVELSTDEDMTLDAAYQDYRIWCKESGHKESAKNSFSRTIQKAVHHKKDTGGKTIFPGMRIASFDFGEN